MHFVLNENRNIPLEGYFWIIDDNIIGTTSEVPMHSYEYQQSKTHEESWNNLKPENCDKSFDYYPRGRVMVDAEYDNDLFTGYSAMIFLDPCIDNKECKEKIVSYYNLDVPQMIHISWMGNLKQRAGLNHYSCHNCRNK